MSIVDSSVDIVIVSFNTARLLADLLHSVPADAAGLQCKTIVVDNASNDGTPDIVSREFPDVKLIANTTNVGFGAANNQGFRAGSGRYIVFLNSDTIVPTGTLTELVRFMDERPRAGACSPRLVRPDGHAQPFAFGGDPTPGYLFVRGWARVFRHRWLHDWETRQIQRVDWVSGACLVARRDALEQIGGFDERYFLYFEDNDLCLRLRRAGWEVWYNPAVTITHLGGASAQQSSSAIRWYDASLRYFYAKHYSALARAALEVMLPFYRRMNSHP